MARERRKSEAAAAAALDAKQRELDRCGYTASSPAAAHKLSGPLCFTLPHATLIQLGRLLEEERRLLERQQQQQQSLQAEGGQPAASLASTV